MATTESESSIDSPARYIDPIQPTYTQGNIAMGRTVDTSNREHENPSAGFPDIIPIPELPRAGLSEIPRPQQQNLTQDTHLVLQGSRYADRLAMHDWVNSGQHGSQAVPLFSACKSVPVQSAPLRIGNSSAPLVDTASHSPAERVDPAYSAYASENHTMRRNLISPLQADTSHHSHATSAEPLRTMLILQLSRAGLCQIPGNQQNVLAQGTHRRVQGMNHEYNPSTAPRNDIGHHAMQTGLSFTSPNVAAVQSVPLRGGSSSAPQVDRAEHLPSGWVYTPPSVEIGSPQHTSA